MASDTLSDWQIARLGDIADVTWGDTSTTKASYTDHGYPAYSASGPDGFLPHADFNRTGVVLSAIGADCGKTWLAKGRWSCIKNTIRFWSTSPEVDTEFLYWFTSNPSFWPRRGSAQPFIAQGDARLLEIKFPPLAEQTRIAETLGALNDKIELNQRMNATLESMARALFQNCFVDFAANNNQVPDGWEMSTIGAEVKVVGGSTPSTQNPEFWEGGEFHWVTPKDFSAIQSKVLIASSRKITKAGLSQISSGLLPENTVLLSSRAPVGYLALTQIKTAINQGFIAMICEGRLPPEYVLLWADSSMDKIKQAASGTTFAEISKGTFRPFSILVPPREKMDAFVNVVRPMFQKIAANERESVSLSEVRDSLLPKLLSGEIRIEGLTYVG